MDFFHNMNLCYVMESMYQSAYQTEHHVNTGSSSYTYCRHNIKGCELVNEDALYHIILLLQHSKFMFVNFIYSIILIL
jgi:hypothetical protein